MRDHHFSASLASIQSTSTRWPVGGLSHTLASQVGGSCAPYRRPRRQPSAGLPASALATPNKYTYDEISAPFCLTHRRCRCIQGNSRQFDWAADVAGLGSGWSWDVRTRPMNSPNEQMVPKGNRRAGFVFNMQNDNFSLALFARLLPLAQPPVSGADGKQHEPSWSPAPSSASPGRVSLICRNRRVHTQLIDPSKLAHTHNHPASIRQLVCWLAGNHQCRWWTSLSAAPPRRQSYNQRR